MSADMRTNDDQTWRQGDSRHMKAWRLSRRGAPVFSCGPKLPWQPNCQALTPHRVGNAARCFGFVKEWIEKKVRRHMMRARGRQGFGWKRWSTGWIYTVLGVFNDYRVQY